MARCLQSEILRVTPTVSSDQLPLFEGLLGAAFEYFAHTTPTVISVKSTGEGGEGATSGFEVPFSWPKHEVGTLAELGSAVAEVLATGPVLLVPPWGQRADHGDKLSRYEHEIILVKCAPHQPESYFRAPQGPRRAMGPRRAAAAPAQRLHLAQLDDRRTGQALPDRPRPLARHQHGFPGHRSSPVRSAVQSTGVLLQSCDYWTGKLALRSDSASRLRRDLYRRNR